MAQKTFQCANILEAEICHNGIQGGDSGHGGYVEMYLTSTDTFTVNGTEMYQCKIRFTGDSERRNLISALKFFITELEK
jgi:hypothetical protein